jgi:hypothetical protein
MKTITTETQDTSAPVFSAPRASPWFKIKCLIVQGLADGAADAGGRPGALAPQRCRKFSATLAILMMFSFARVRVARTLSHHRGEARGGSAISNGCVSPPAPKAFQTGLGARPLTAVMLVMVTFVSTLIFICSVSYSA